MFSLESATMTMHTGTGEISIRWILGTELKLLILGGGGGVRVGIFENWNYDRWYHLYRSTAGVISGYVVVIWQCSDSIMCLSRSSYFYYADEVDQYVLMRQAFKLMWIIIILVYRGWWHCNMCCCVQILLKCISHCKLYWLWETHLVLVGACGYVNTILSRWIFMLTSLCHKIIPIILINSTFQCHLIW